jgi:hypothetical protein
MGGGPTGDPPITPAAEMHPRIVMELKNVKQVNKHQTGVHTSLWGPPHGAGPPDLIPAANQMRPMQLRLHCLMHQ